MPYIHENISGIIFPQELFFLVFYVRIIKNKLFNFSHFTLVFPRMIKTTNVLLTFNLRVDEGLRNSFLLTYTERNKFYVLEFIFILQKKTRSMYKS